MKPNPELDPKLDALLQFLRQTTPRDSQRALKARDSFLAEVAQFAPRVSISTQSRLNKWKENLRNFWLGTQKEQKPMFNIFMTVLLALGVVFAGGATTVTVAQAAQPNETLYPVKTWSEDLRLGWESDPQVKLDLALEFTARRADEIQNLFVANNSIPEQVITRFGNQQQQSLNVAAGLPDDQTIPALERIREQAIQQEQALAALNIQNQAAQETHIRLQSMIQTQEQFAQMGIQDPNWLRQRNRNRIQLSPPTVISTETGQTPVSSGIPWTTGTPTPGSGYGSGGSQNPWTTGTPTPGSGYGSGGSQNPWTTGTPTPGSGYGPGSGTGDCTTCTPNPKDGNPTQQPGSDNGNDDNSGSGVGGNGGSDGSSGGGNDGGSDGGGSDGGGGDGGGGGGSDGGGGGSDGGGGGSDGGGGGGGGKP